MNQNQLAHLIALLQCQQHDGELRHDGRLVGWERTCTLIRRALADEEVRPALLAAINATLGQHQDLLLDPERQRRLGEAARKAGGPGPGEIPEEDQ